THFFDLYERWLAKHDCQHSPATLRRWLEDGYSPGPALARIELLEPLQVVPLDQPLAVRVRAHNLSAETWHFQPGNNAGVHGGYILSFDSAKQIRKGQAGLFRAEVEPGHSIDLTLAVPPITIPGRCFLMVDMRDEQQISWFYQSGSQPLYVEFEARAP